MRSFATGVAIAFMLIMIWHVGNIAGDIDRIATALEKLPTLPNDSARND